jgi:hypothetical protein
MWTAKSFVKAVLSYSFTCAVLWSQASTSQINGVVVDPTGLTIPGAEVRATQTDTGLVRTTTSAADGAYVLTNLPVGPYTLEIRKDGFSKYVQTGIVLQVNTNPTIDAALRVGSVSDQVTVEGGAALVETHSTGIGTVVDTQRVVEMPLNGRDSTQLIFLSGMATAGTIPQLRNFPAASISVAGGQGNGITYLLDGANHNDVSSSLNLPLPFPDALQEFKVETSALSPQYGMHSAATVNAVTKSGTNQFHGDLFEFLRNGDFNARNFFAPTRDTLKQNQFGGTIGGPVLRDKLFFFGGFQRTSRRSDPPGSIAFVPTPESLAGDFRTLASPACNGGRQLTLPVSRGFNNNQIAATSLNPVAVKIASLLPVPTDATGCGKVTFGNISNSDQTDFVARMDYQITSKHTLFGRATTNVLSQPTTYDGKNPLTLNTNGTRNAVYTLTLGHTWLISPNIVSSFRVAANRTSLTRTPDKFFSWNDLGANVTDVGAGKTIRLTVQGNGFTIGGVNGTPGAAFSGPNPQLGEDISIIKGNHQIGIGANYIFQLMNYWSGLNAPGAFTFSGQTTTLGLADFLIGNPSAVVQGNIYGFTLRQNYIGLYAQDTWKITPRLTVTYGLRWEPYLAVYSKYGQFMHFDQTRFTQGLKSQVYVNAPAGMTYPGDPTYTPGRSVENNKYLKFGPRIGVVWDPKGDGRMTIRAAYGMFNDRQHAFSLNFIAQNQPFGYQLQPTSPSLSNPWVNYAGGNPFPLNTGKDAAFQAFGSVINHPLDLQPTYLNQWNFSIQRQVGTNWLLTANYIGNNTVHLTTSNQYNYAQFLGTGACTLQTVNAAGQVVASPQTVCSTVANQNLRRVLYLQNPVQGQYFAGVPTVDDGGTATYEALFLSVQKRLSSGLSILTNYTWSHCISDIFDTQTGAQGASAAAIPGNRLAYHGNCGTSDQRHLFNLSLVAATPRFSNRALRIAATGWQVSTILRLQSAREFTVTSGLDVALSTQPGQTPNLNTALSPYVSDRNVCSNPPCVAWLTSKAFTSATAGTYGNLGYNNINGPGVVTLDMNMTRSFRIRERMSLQFRAEAFNLPNRTNFNTPTATLNSGNFGVITSAGDPRIVQLAMKFIF